MKHVFADFRTMQFLKNTDSGKPNVNFQKISIRKTILTILDLEFSEFFFLKFRASLPLLEFSNIQNMV